MIETIYNAIGWTLLHSIWQVCLVILLVYFILNTSWLKKPNHRYLALAFAFGIIGILSGFTFSIYFNPTPETAIQSINQNPILLISPEDLIKNKPFWIEWLDNNLVYFTMAWISGFFLYSIRLIGGLAYLSILRKKAHEVTDPHFVMFLESLLNKSGKKVKTSILLSDRILTPITFGIFRVSIVFPVSYFNQLSLEETEVILAHELAHIIRYDYLVNIFVRILKTFLYFHPGIWWLSNQMEAEREKATDEMACHLSGTGSLQYAKTLLKAQQLVIQERVQSDQLPENALALPFLKNKKQLLLRVEHLLGNHKKRNQWTHRMVSLVLFLGIFSLLSFTQIILPRNGTMVHPTMEAEAISEEKSFEIEAIIEEDVADSMSIEMIVKVEEHKNETADNASHIVKETTQIGTNNNQYLEREVEVFVLKDSSFSEKEVFINRIKNLPDINIEFDTIIKTEKIIFMGNIDFHKNKNVEFLRQKPTLDTLAQSFFIQKDNKISKNIPEWVENSGRFEPSLMKFREHYWLADSISNKWFQSFNKENRMDFTWEFIPDKNDFLELGDSIIRNYKLDQHVINNLKMEGLEHIEEFRFRHFPVDENRIVKILYIES